MDNNLQAFLALVRSGLWEQDIQLLPYGAINYNEVYRLAEEQSVVGLVAAGLEHVKDVKIPQEVALHFVGNTIQLEKRNTAMNAFIASLIEKLRLEGIYTLLVKGQGIAQCYERPLWRACGDVDLLLSAENYDKAKIICQQLASSIDEEDTKRKHLSITINNWIVELHGALLFNLSSRVDNVIQEAQCDVFYNGDVRSWLNGNTQVFLPSPNSDIIFVFTHFLHHFFIEGVGFRQICDWCRLLYSYKDTIDCNILERRLFEAGLMTEWMVFASVAVNTLGMTEDAIPFYSKGKRYNRKSFKIIKRIIKTGNMGHNNDLSYRNKNNKFIVNIITFFRRFSDFVSIMSVFPVDVPRFFVTYIFNRIK